MRVFSFSLLFPRTEIEYSLINSLVAPGLSVAQMVSFVATAAGGGRREQKKGFSGRNFAPPQGAENFGHRKPSTVQKLC